MCVKARREYWIDEVWEHQAKDAFWSVVSRDEVDLIDGADEGVEGVEGVEGDAGDAGDARLKAKITMKSLLCPYFCQEVKKGRSGAYSFGFTLDDLRCCCGYEDEDLVNLYRNNRARVLI